LDGADLSVLTHDGSLTTIQDGKAIKTAEVKDEANMAKSFGARALDAALAKSQARPDRIVKLTAKGGEHSAVAYWGGTVRVVDAKGTVISEQLLPQDVTALAWQGDKVIAGLADGRVLALSPK
jgi:hypothetical protein